MSWLMFLSGIWMISMGLVLILGELKRSEPFSPKVEPKEENLRVKLERTKRRADKKRGQKIS
jgi:hypothetical protein